MVRFRLLLGVGTHHGSERTCLHPTHIQLFVARILRVNGETTEIGTHVGET